MQKIIKIQRIFIAILLVLSLTISILSYKLQIEAISVAKENKELKEIIEIKEEIENV